MNPMPRRMATFLLASAAVLAAAGAWAQDDARKVAPEHLTDFWILLNTKVDADVPNTGRNLDKPGCAAVSYLIGTDGVPRDIQVRKVVPDGDLGKVAASAIANFRYGPSLNNRSDAPVSTYYIVPFNAPDDTAQRQQLTAACRLPGYEN